MINNNPSYRILPTAPSYEVNITDQFDERTIINDDLNMNHFFIYNLKNPEDDQDAVTKIYVDTKVYNINSGNIIGNLPWDRIVKPDYFPSRTSMLLVDSNIDIGHYKFMKNGVEIIGLTDNSVLTQHLSNGSVSNNKIISMNYNKLTDVPTSFPSILSTLTIDSDIDMDTYTISVPTPTNDDHVVNKAYVDSLDDEVLTINATFTLAGMGPTPATVTVRLIKRGKVCIVFIPAFTVRTRTSFGLHNVATLDDIPVGYRPSNTQMGGTTVCHQGTTRITGINICFNSNGSIELCHPTATNFALNTNVFFGKYSDSYTVNMIGIYVLD